MSAKIKVRIDKQGQVHIDVDGVTGTSCQDLTRLFEEKLGLDKEVQLKPDYDVVLDDMQIKQYEN